MRYTQLCTILKPVVFARIMSGSVRLMQCNAAQVTEFHHFWWDAFTYIPSKSKKVLFAENSRKFCGDLVTQSPTFRSYVHWLFTINHNIICHRQKQIHKNSPKNRLFLFQFFSHLFDVILLEIKGPSTVLLGQSSWQRNQELTISKNEKIAPTILIEIVCSLHPRKFGFAYC